MVPWSSTLGVVAFLAGDCANPRQFSVAAWSGADNNSMDKENTSPLKPRTGRGQRKTISTAKASY